MSSEILKKLISSNLRKNQEMVDLQVAKLTNSGDNYGSILLALDVKVKSEDNKEDRVYLVAKMLPSNELVQEMFNTQYTFPNEVGFYQTIIPCLRQFQNEQKVAPISCFPNFFAASITTNSSGKISQDSVLLIENIKKEGFQILDRTTGFDVQQSQLILEKMAELHATALALKVQKPEIFQDKVSPFLQEYEIFVMDDEANNKMIKGAIDAIRDDEFCAGYLAELEDILLKSSRIIPKQNDQPDVDNPFLTLVHNDMWTNNIMVKIINDKTIDVKFVDHQLYQYTSLTRDVVFFLFASTSVQVLQNHCDSLLRHYYENFIGWLSRLNCDSQKFSFEGFLEDMKFNVKKYEFFHAMTMLPPIYVEPKDAKAVEEMDMDSFVFHENEVTQPLKEKACFIVKEFVKRGWLL